LTTEKALAEKRKSVRALKFNPTTCRFLTIVFRIWHQFGKELSAKWKNQLILSKTWTSLKTLTIEEEQ
jgi:hypothetical protein